jgi:hypothetical protein
MFIGLHVNKKKQCKELILMPVFDLLLQFSAQSRGFFLLSPLLHMLVLHPNLSGKKGAKYQSCLASN